MTPGRVEDAVTLVIPARDAEETIEPCLSAARRDRERGLLSEVVLVDDGSRDRTGEIGQRLGARVIRGSGAGPGAARNLGWRAAKTSLIWFVDADCIAEPDALPILLRHLKDPAVGAVGGSYGNLTARSLVSFLIHEEIVERHRAMPPEVDFLATFNVLYRREALEQVEGFDERFLKAQDAELAYRVRDRGWRLRFDPSSRVGHFHVTSLGRYLRVQLRQGYWRAWLYVEHPGKSGGDAYSSLADHAQPAIALLLLLAIPLLPLGVWSPAATAAGLLLVLPVPRAVRLFRATGSSKGLLYPPFAAVRAVVRAVGFVLGLASRFVRGGAPR